MFYLPRKTSFIPVKLSSGNVYHTSSFSDVLEFESNFARDFWIFFVDCEFKPRLETRKKSFAVKNGSSSVIKELCRCIIIAK